jgi:hypothetical protein
MSWGPAPIHVASTAADDRSPAASEHIACRGWVVVRDDGTNRSRAFG